jgi:hypothetical protein
MGTLQARAATLPAWEKCALRLAVVAECLPCG